MVENIFYDDAPTLYTCMSHICCVQPTSLVCKLHHCCSIDRQNGDYLNPTL